MRRVLLLFISVCFFIIGCSDNVDIGLVANQLQAAQAESAVQSTLPEDVIAAMKYEADTQRKWIKNTLESPHTAKFRWDQRALLIKNGITTDFDPLKVYLKYYTKSIDAGGIAIVGPDRVEDKYFHWARDAVRIMTSKHPELREGLLSKHQRFYMVIVDQSTEFFNLPENQTNSLVLDESLPREQAYRAGGCDAHWGTHIPSGMCWSIMNPRVFIHEFAHALEFQIWHLRPGFRERLKKIYEEQLAEIGEERASQVHIMTNTHEHWANGVEWWFSGKGWPEKLYREYPLLAELIEEWFPKVTYTETGESVTIPEQGYHEWMTTSVSWKVIEEE
ncbi:MAG: hypothetical protein OXU23_17300 [Candidatus Poribacteria bacterium]|nr:hypothetical protein [Candidatus Poribacteria bacterium]